MRITKYVECLENKDTVSENRQDVYISRLDDLFYDWIPALGGRVGALKIDTEGVEPFVFQGGTEFFSRVKPDYMQMEISVMNELSTGVKAAKLLHWVEMFGYTVHERVDGPAVEPNDIVLISPGKFSTKMYFFLQRIYEFIIPLNWQL